MAIKKTKKKEKAKKVSSGVKTAMDEKIELAMGQIVDETLKDQEEWKSTYKKENKDKKNKDKKNKDKKSKVSGGRKKNTSDGKTRLKIAAIGVGIAVIAIGVIYGGGAYYYRDKFFNRTTINNLRCGNMTAEAAEKQIKDAAENYVMELSFKENKKETISGKDIKYTYLPSGEIKELLEKQNPLLWVKALLKPEKYTVGGEMQFDENLLSEKLYSFDSMKDANMVQPVDACIAFENNQFVIKDEVVGTTIDKESFLGKVKDAIHKCEPKLSAEKSGAYVLPAVTKEAESLKHQQEVWNSCAAVTVTYTFGDQTEILDGMTVKDWMTYDEAGNYVENDAVLQENIKNYVVSLGEKYNTVGKARKIVSTATGEEITVEGGSYGFLIDGKAEREQLLADIQAHADTKREPVYARTAKSREGNEIGNTYVEVDLTAQHLWFYKEGKLILDSNFVSGTYYSKGRRTPGGAYYLYYKQRDTVLRPAPNPDGSYAYESPVKYWMPFNGGIGFHDASWRGRFGGSIYLYGGSHGCINLPSSFAGQFYENIEADCPVICFYR